MIFSFRKGKNSADDKLVALLLFNERDYVNFHSDVRKAISEGAYKSGFDHYRNNGIYEGRFPGFDGFSADEYLAINPDVAKSAEGRDKEAVAREHFSRVGFSEGRRWTSRL
jgi:hypothetical protein